MSNLPGLNIRRNHLLGLFMVCSSLLIACATTIPSTQSQAKRASSDNTKPASSSPGELARSADSFVDSIGVNIHLTYEDTVYGKFSNIVKPRLQELGVRHVRDGGHNEDDYINKLQQLSTVGIKSILIFQGTPTDEVLQVLAKAKGAINAAEGPNESDLEKFNYSYNGERFPEGTRTYQKELYTAIKGSSENYLPVVLPSMGWGENAQKLGYLQWGDRCNLHSYPANGERPTYDIDWYFIPHGRTICGKTKPLMVTETGYHNSLKEDAGMSEKASGKYIPRLLLENFNRNIMRTYLYEFLNLRPDPTQSDKENHYGLVRNDGSRKPAYQAIKNLITLLKDPKANFRPGSLDYKLTGNMKEVNRTLLQKSDRSFYLVIWQDAKSWDNKNKKDVAIADRKLTLNIKTPISQVVAYQPIKSVNPSWRSTGKAGRVKQLSINVPDHPLVLKLVPASKK